MQIIIQASGFDLSAGLREHVERRIHFALDRASHYVRKVSIRLSDVNGPRGGEDKRCCIQVTVAGAADMLIEDTEPDLYVAIDRAADRSGRTLARLLARLTRTSPRKPAWNPSPRGATIAREVRPWRSVPERGRIMKRTFLLIGTNLAIMLVLGHRQHPDRRPQVLLRRRA
jgi:putative sigma-54 modulation protein